MTFHYTDPKREDERYSLPDVEIWEDTIYEVTCRCGVYEVPGIPELPLMCPSCEREAETYERTDRNGWFYWFSLPGCLPDSTPFGPFETEAEALADAREYAGVEDEDEENET